jgi:hypothetical protein
MSARSAPSYYLDEHSDSDVVVEDEVVEVIDISADYTATRQSKACIAFAWSTAQLLWGLFLLAVAVWKIATSSILDFINHFTNVSWSWQAFFFLATAFGPVWIAWRMRAPLRFVTFVIAALLMPLFGIIVAVVIVIFILIGTDAGAIVLAFSQYPPEIVIIGNDFYHVVPVIAFLIYIALNRRHVFYALNLGLQYILYVDEDLDTRLAVRTRIGTVVVRRRVARRRYRYVSWALFLYQAYLGSLVPLLFYLAVFDPRVIYGTHMSFGVGLFILFISLTLSNAIPLAIAIYGWGLGTRALTVDNYLFQ